MKKSKEILASDIWDKQKREGLKELIVSHSKKQNEERKLRNELLAIRYQIEDSIENDACAAFETITPDFD